MIELPPRDVSYKAPSTGYLDYYSRADHVHQLGKFPRVKMIRKTNYTTPHGAAFVIFDDTHYNPDKMGAIGSTDIIIPLSGLWYIGHNWAPPATTGFYIEGAIYINNTYRLCMTGGNIPVNAGLWYSSSTDIELKKGDVLNLRIFQNSGAGITMPASGTDPHTMWATFRGI